jgi:ketosteroid isomerase-like protein
MNRNSNQVGALIFFLFYFGVTGCTNTQVDSETAIREILDKQVAEWNGGDIPAFMDTYVKTDELRFSSGGNVQRGYEETFNRYLTRYPNPDSMGHLLFEDLEVKLLSEEWAQVHGRYRLKRGGDYENATGLFTLLLQQKPEGWKILHDHTSAGD